MSEQTDPVRAGGPPRLLILALGNPLRGDDGAGLAVLAEIEQQHHLPDNVALLDGGTSGLEMVLYFDSYAHVIIIDAADMGIPAGTWRCFPPDTVLQLAGSEMRGNTLHSAGLQEALAMAQALGILPHSTWIYGIQPALAGWEVGLSAAVAAGVPAIALAVTDHAQRLMLG